MTEKDAFAKRERWLEEKYFRKQEEELIERLRRRSELREVTGITDENVLDDLQVLGYTGETAKTLLWLVPLLQVAWSEGFVTEREREQIYAAARRIGMQEGTPAYRQLCAWLDQRPSDEVFARTLGVIRHVLAVLPAEERERRKSDLMIACSLVASASGSVLEVWDLVSDTEWSVMQQIALELESETEAAARPIIESGSQTLQSPGKL